LFDLIKLVATAMIKCIDKQLVDFLPGGKFHDVLNENDVRCTKKYATCPQVVRFQYGPETQIKQSKTLQ
jgi:hypothetical protein